mgnify:CR=1 FL=1
MSYRPHRHILFFKFYIIITSNPYQEDPCFILIAKIRSKNWIDLLIICRNSHIYVLLFALCFYISHELLSFNYLSTDSYCNNFLISSFISLAAVVGTFLLQLVHACVYLYQYTVYYFQKHQQQLYQSIFGIQFRRNLINYIFICTFRFVVFSLLPVIVAKQNIPIRIWCFTNRLLQ